MTARDDIPAAEIEAAAEVIWNDFSARMGGPWSDVPPVMTAAIQCRATAKACLEAALASRHAPHEADRDRAAEKERIREDERAWRGVYQFAHDTWVGLHRERGEGSHAEDVYQIRELAYARYEAARAALRSRTPAPSRNQEADNG